MSHEITQRADGAYEMAYVGKKPWHGLGQELPVGASVAEMQRAAGLDWQIERAKVEYTHGILTDMQRFDFQDRHVLYRSDTMAPLSVVSHRYKVVQPSEILGFFRDLVGEGGFQLETAGSLFGGKRIWATALVGEKAKIRGEDEIGGYLLLSTSCDGSLATTARFTTIRTVCNNTLGMALEDNRRFITVTHATKFDHERVKQDLGIAVDAFSRFMVDATTLAEKKLGYGAATQFLDTLLLPNYKGNAEAMRNSTGYERIMELFQGEAIGSEFSTAKGTAWGMVQAVTEFYDHHANTRTPDARLNSAWFGTAAATKERAFEIAKAI